MPRSRPKPNGRALRSYIDKDFIDYKYLADVTLQDQTTDAIISYFSQIHNQTTLDVAGELDDKIISVTDATGIVAGSYLTLFDAASLRFTPFFVTAVNGTDITLDSPLDFAYPVNTNIDVAIVDLSVDGSSTVQVFGLRGGGTPPGVDLKFDVTRIIFSCIASSAVNLSLFANITALTNGLLVRLRNGRYKNLFNVKDNREMAGIMFDFNVSAADNPVQGEDGFIGRLTFAGQNKIGVAVRLGIGEDLEVHIQDNLTGITNFFMIAEGHIVED